jgi:hypothetical protein
MDKGEGQHLRKEDRYDVAMQMVDNVDLHKIAKAVEAQLKKAFDAIK